MGGGIGARSGVFEGRPVCTGQPGGYCADPEQGDGAEPEGRGTFRNVWERRAWPLVLEDAGGGVWVERRRAGDPGKDSLSQQRQSGERHEFSPGPGESRVPLK